MKFPESTRVRYSRNPLVEVICQLRFPKILKIETEAPVDFQEAVRSDYPIFSTPRTLEMSLLANSQPNSPPVLLGQGFSYEFADKGGEWKLVLSSDFIALSTFNYKSWEDFRNRLSTAINLLIEYYRPSYFTRIGLRYQDIIMRSELGVADRPWRELLKPPILGIFAAEDLPEDDFPEAFSLFVCRLGYADAIVSARYGLARKNESNELGYFIDADFHTEKITEIKDADEHLNRFNREGRNFFQWCITPKLHQVLGPEPIEE